MPRSGDWRNVRCHRYGSCLERAIAKREAGLSCQGCRFQRSEAAIQEYELEGCWLLLWRLFRPELYRKAMAEERKQSGQRKLKTGYQDPHQE